MYLRFNIRIKLFLSSYSVVPMDDADYDLVDEDLNDLEEEEDDDEEFLFKGSALSQPMWVLPLYSLLSSQKQSKVKEKLFLKKNPHGTFLGL